jgi:hypothetical protein
MVWGFEELNLSFEKGKIQTSQFIVTEKIDVPVIKKLLGTPFFY